MSTPDDLPALVIGAGPAGLATSAELKRLGVTHRVLEAGSQPGYTWPRLYDSLRLHTGKHMSTLPGLRFGRDVPLFPSREVRRITQPPERRGVVIPIVSHFVLAAFLFVYGSWHV